MRAFIREKARRTASAPVRLAVAGAALSLALAGCGNESGKAAPAQPQALPVTIKHVQPQRVPIVLDAVGRAEGSREVEIRARVGGILEKRLYDEGAPVKAGQTLFIIERAPYSLAVTQARAALSQERARLDQARREARRLESLAKSRAISQREYEDAVSTFKQSTAAIEGAEAKLAEAKLNLSYTDVKAPIGGITGRAVRSEGSLVTANTDLLTTLTQVHPIWVRFSLAEQDFERIRAHARQSTVNILARDGSIAAKDGRLNFAGSTVDASLGTVQLRAEFPNPAFTWLPGQFLRVQILAGEQEAFLVPQQAVIETEAARMVWVAQPDGQATMKPVQTANWLRNDWVVTGGLKPGDAVIVDNLMKLRPGVRVKPHAAEQKVANPPPPASAPARDTRH